MNTELFTVDSEAVDLTLNRLFPSEELPGFSELFSGFLSGKYTVAAIGEILSDTIVSGFFTGMNEMKHIFFLSFAMAVFFLLARSEKQGPAVEAGFFITYLLTVAELVKLYQSSAGIVLGALERLTEFLKVFLPVYCTGIAVAAGSSSAAAFYGAAFGGITAAGMVMKQFVLPLTGFYFLIAVFNRMFREDILSELAKVFQAAAQLLMKLCIWAVLGLGGIRGMLAPAADGVKRSGVLRLAGAIPVVGDLFDGATQTVLAAGELVKNAIGAAGAVLVFLICFLPAFKLGISCVILRVGAAFLQPISDKRIGDCLEVSAKTHKLLFQILMYSMLLFLILILMFAAFTGIGGNH